MCATVTCVGGRLAAQAQLNRASESKGSATGETKKNRYRTSHDPRFYRLYTDLTTRYFIYLGRELCYKKVLGQCFLLVPFLTRLVPTNYSEDKQRSGLRDSCVLVAQYI